MVRIEFEDNGIGIAEKHQKQIFKIFGRVYSEKKYEGTGIGLAIVKKAAERMGGALGLESEFGKGSKFFVLLRRAE
jgi:signal transduction histidine kinase